VIYATLNDRRVIAARVTVGQTGPWTADVELEGEADVSGLVTLRLGGTAFVGTVDLVQNGPYSGRLKCRVVAGAHGWHNDVGAKNYHNDAQIRARTLAEDAAREVGETIGEFAPGADRVGVDYVRRAGRAATVLEDSAGGVAWWVGYDGITRVMPREQSVPGEDSYEVLACDPGERVVLVGVTDVSAVRIGSELRGTLTGSYVARELEIVVDVDGARITAWCDDSASVGGRLQSAFRALVSRASDSRIWGKYRYRVIRMAVDRVECQIVRRASGLPDVLPISMWPGVPGMHATLTPGAEVLVEFIEGDRTMPVVVGFVGRGGTGHVPVVIELGGEGGSEVARRGDEVEVLLPPAVFSGTIGGAPATGVLTFTLNKTSGVITNGSAKVKVAT
jgi:hypothetical protein